MSKDRGDTRLQIVLPDPDDEHLLHSFSVDPEIVRFLCSVLEPQHIAATSLDRKAFARAVCGALFEEGKLIRVDG